MKGTTARAQVAVIQVALGRFRSPKVDDLGCFRLH